MLWMVEGGGKRGRRWEGVGSGERDGWRGSGEGGKVGDDGIHLRAKFQIFGNVHQKNE